MPYILTTSTCCGGDGALKTAPPPPPPPPRIFASESFVTGNPLLLQLPWGLTMTTLARQESSRRNGSRSRGPISVEGKSRSSRNALKHGALAQVHRPVGESPELVESAVTMLSEAVVPTNEFEEELVTRLALDLVRQKRIDRYLDAAGSKDVLVDDKEEENLKESIRVLRHLKGRWSHQLESLATSSETVEDLLGIAKDICTLLKEVSQFEEHPDRENSGSRRLLQLLEELRRAKEIIAYGMHHFSPDPLHEKIADIATEQISMLDEMITKTQEQLDRYRQLRHQMANALPPEAAVKLAGRYQRLLNRSLDSNLEVLGKLRALANPGDCSISD